MVDFHELTDEQRADLLAQAEEQVLNDLVTEPREGNRDDKLAELRKQLDLSAFADIANIEELSESLNAQMEAILMDQVNRLEAQAGRRMAQLVAEMKRKNDIAEFCQHAVGGTEASPVGLPVQEDELVTFMSSLSSEQYKAAKSIFGRILESGLNDFSEIGHGREVEGTQDLPAGVDRLLERHLKNGGSLEAFFEVAEIGPASQYNLAKYKEQDNG